LGVVRDIWLGLASSYKIAVAKPEIGQSTPYGVDWPISAIFLLSFCLQKITVLA
jgi:hypothetical protein